MKRKSVISPDFLLNFVRANMAGLVRIRYRASDPAICAINAESPLSASFSDRFRSDDKPSVIFDPM